MVIEIRERVNTTAAKVIVRPDTGLRSKYNQMAKQYDEDDGIGKPGSSHALSPQGNFGWRFGEAY